LPRLLRLHEIGLHGDGALVMRQRFAEFALVEQGDAEIALRPGIVGIDLDRSLSLDNRLVDATGEAAHLAEIGMVERHIGPQRDGAP